jgi:tRNA-Thr(GGU) m(6)t(6)A37 methyltransferase TsaA
VLTEYEEGLKDLDGFSHLILIYHFHRSDAVCLTVQPFLQDVDHGVFSTRAPCRPNPIGLSIVELVRREGCTLHLDGVDILDNTPLIDIKPTWAGSTASAHQGRVAARGGRIHGTAQGEAGIRPGERSGGSAMIISVASGKGGTARPRCPRTWRGSGPHRCSSWTATWRSPTATCSSRAI